MSGGAIVWIVVLVVILVVLGVVVALMMNKRKNEQRRAHAAELRTAGGRPVRLDRPLRARGQAGRGRGRGARAEAERAERAAAEARQGVHMDQATRRTGSARPSGSTPTTSASDPEHRASLNSGRLLRRWSPPSLRNMSQVPAATRALRVLRFLASQPDPVPLDRIMRACDLPRSTAYHLLRAMVDEGFVVHLADEHRFGLGRRGVRGRQRLLPPGAAAADRPPAARRARRPGRAERAPRGAARPRRPLRPRGAGAGPAAAGHRRGRAPARRT